MKKNISIKTIVAIGIGTAIFVVLSRFGSIPSGIPNTNIETSYAILAFFALLFGPIAGLAIGLIGHFLKDTLMYGTPWISWVIASGVVGLIIGFLSKNININDGIFGKKEILSFNVLQIFANAFAWFLIAPVLDILIYAEPANKVFLQGFVAGGTNILTIGILGTLLSVAYSKTRTKPGSLNKEA